MIRRNYLRSGWFPWFSFFSSIIWGWGEMGGEGSYWLCYVAEMKRKGKKS